MKNYLWKYNVSFYRQGNLEGLFIANEKQVSMLTNVNLNFGEVLGKHSDVNHKFNLDQFVKVPVSDQTVQELFYAIGPVISGEDIFGLYSYIYYGCKDCNHSDYELHFCTSSQSGNLVYRCPNCKSLNVEEI